MGVGDSRVRPLAESMDKRIVEAVKASEDPAYQSFIGEFEVKRFYDPNRKIWRVQRVALVGGKTTKAAQLPVLVNAAHGNFYERVAFLCEQLAERAPDGFHASQLPGLINIYPGWAQTVLRSMPDLFDVEKVYGHPNGMAGRKYLLKFRLSATWRDVITAKSEKTGAKKTTFERRRIIHRDIHEAVIRHAVSVGKPLGVRQVCPESIVTHPADASRRVSDMVKFGYLAQVASGRRYPDYVPTEAGLALIEGEGEE